MGCTGSLFRARSLLPTELSFSRVGPDVSMPQGRGDDVRQRIWNLDNVPELSLGRDQVADLWGHRGEFFDIRGEPPVHFEKPVLRIGEGNHIPPRECYPLLLFFLCILWNDNRSNDPCNEYDNQDVNENQSLFIF